MDSNDPSQHASHTHDNLIRTAQGQSPQAATALAAIFAAYRPLIKGTVSHRVYNAALRADAEQEANIALYLAVSRFDLLRGTNFSAYAKRYVSGAVLNSVRANGVSHQWEALDTELIGDDQPDSDDPITTAAVREFVASLPEGKRRIVEAVYWEGRSQADVARELGVSRAAINKQLRSVFRQGQQQLAAFDPARYVA